MMITIRLVGSLRASTKKSSFTLELADNSSVREAVEAIGESLPKLRRALVDPEFNDPQVNALVLVNGKELSVLHGLETALKDGDQLVMIPVVHGG